MIEIMFQGEGGHGSVVAAKLLAKAAAKSGFKAQSFASYGALRRGGKVEGYVRLSKTDIPLRCKMTRADYLVIMGKTIVDENSTPSSLKKNGKILINTDEIDHDYPFLDDYEIYLVDAIKIAQKKKLIIPGGFPVINTTLLGALASILKSLPLNILTEVIKENTPKPEINAACAEEGYNQTLAAHQFKSGSQKTGNSVQPATGSRYPVHDPAKMKLCHRCQNCYIFCPNLAISYSGDPLEFSVDRELCTQCGICIEECPRNAIAWEG